MGVRLEFSGDIFVNKYIIMMYCKMDRYQKNKIK